MLIQRMFMKGVSWEATKAFLPFYCRHEENNNFRKTYAFKFMRVNGHKINGSVLCYVLFKDYYNVFQFIFSIKHKLEVFECFQAILKEI